MKIFVYGSLKKNKKLHHFLSSSVFVSNASTCYKYPMILSKNGWYPYLLSVKNKGYYVKGEVYEIDYKTLKKLDRLEEVPHYYKRKKICVKINNKKLLVWCYFFSKKKKYRKKDLLKEF